MCEDFMELNKMFPDSKIAAHMALKRTKCTTLANVFGNYVAGKLAQKLQSNKFSVMKQQIVPLINMCHTSKIL